MTQDRMRIHFVGVGGVGMGSLAIALSQYGHTVSGSDLALYDPMKTELAKAKVTLYEGFLEAPQTEVTADLVIIGNVVRKENPEACAWMKSGVPFLSFPEAVRTLVIKDKTSVVCAGTHGKTTTTTWISFLLKELGMNPSYLIGGVPKDLPTGCFISDGQVSVCEGDEYDSAFFDKGPKFLHYNPSTLILSSIEFDHADIYRDLAHVRSSFEKLIALLPGDGVCIARYEDPVVMEVVSGALCPVQTFGMTGAMWRIGKIEETEKGLDFEVIYKGRSAGNFQTRMFGEHNLANILSGIVAAVNLGAPMDKIRPIVAEFHGVKRRQEILLEDPILLIDDFAHHPTEVGATLKAVRRRHPQKRIWAMFEPRSATARRNVHQEDYAKAFDSADQILIASPFKKDALQEQERLSESALVDELKERGKSAHFFGKASEIVDHFKSQFTPGDIVVVMSNGEFDKIQTKLIEAVR